jgi:hypothetical protein
MSELLRSRCHFGRTATIRRFKKGHVDFVTKIDEPLSTEDQTLQWLHFINGLVLLRHVELEWELLPQV